MPTHRSYRLLCPIARALDRVGDRWTLLILRDLHAGPARFTELQHGLKGLASNLLTSRLKQLQEDGLVRRTSGPHGTQLYELTSEGEATAPLLFELGMYGSRFAPGADIRRPGNLRTIAVNLKESLRRSVTPDVDVYAELVYDGEAFEVRVDNGAVTVRYGEAPDAPVSIAMDYEPLIDVVDGRMRAEEFVAGHVRPRRGTADQIAAFMGVLARGFRTPTGVPEDLCCRRKSWPASQPRRRSSWDRIHPASEFALTTLTAPQTIPAGEPFTVTFASEERVAGRLRLTLGTEALSFTLVREGKEPVTSSNPRVRGRAGALQITDWGDHGAGTELVLRFEGAKAWLTVT